MLEIRLEGDVLEVKETIHGFISNKVNFFYYDVKNWLVSSFGKQGDKPDRPMTPEGIEWVKKYYLPHVKG